MCREIASFFIDIIAQDITARKALKAVNRQPLLALQRALNSDKFHIYSSQISLPTTEKFRVLLPNIKSNIGVENIGKKGDP